MTLHANHSTGSLDGGGRLLITGATGFIGRALVARLVRRLPPDLLSLPVRDAARAERSGLPAAAVVETELDGGPRLRDAAAGAGVVVHLAGAVRACSRRELDAANVDATTRLLEVLPAHARFVLVSSLAAAGPSVDGARTSEPAAACAPVSHYGESKRQGELALLAEAARSQREWLVLRPCLVYGPGDAATALLFRQATGPLCAVPWRPRPLSTLHVEDLCDAIELALARTAASGTFLPVAGEVSDTHRLMRSIADACGRRARLVSVPDHVVECAGSVADVVSRMRRRPSYFSRDKAREITAAGWVADTEPARLRLGFTARIGLQRGLGDVAREVGWAPRAARGDPTAERG